MNLLHVIDKMAPERGGVCQAVRTMLPGLAQRGTKNEVVSLDAPNSPFLQTHPFPVHACGPSVQPWEYSSKLIPWLLGNFLRFDIIIVHGLWLYHSYAVGKVLKILKKKVKKDVSPRVYIMPHGMMDPYFQHTPSRKLKAVRNWVYWKLIESHMVNNAAGLLFTCDEERRLARQPFVPYRPKREAVVGLGVEEPPSLTAAMQEAFNCQCPGLNRNPYLLFLGRIHQKKGIDILLQAYSKIKNQITGNPNDRNEQGEETLPTTRDFPKLVVAGPGLDTTFGRKIQRSVYEDHTLRDNVFFPGMLKGEAKWGALYGCEAFVLPSHQENFGIAIVEALACSKPVLISRQINIWNEIEAAGGGIVANDTLMGTMEMLKKWHLLSQHKRTTMRQNARSAFCKYFATGPAAERLLAVVSEM